MTTLNEPQLGQADAFERAKSSTEEHLHALSREVRRCWHELENKLDGLDARLRQGEPDAEAHGAFAKVTELSGMIKGLLNSAVSNAEELSYKVRVLIRGPAVTCAPSDSLAQAAKLLWEKDIGALVVTDAANHALGILTDRDICMAAYTRGLPLHAMDAASCMSTTLHAIDADSSISELCALLAEHRVRRAPVLEGGRLVGVVALGDVIRLAGASSAGFLPLAALTARVLERICEPRRPDLSNSTH